jgi:uncharacterized protein (TIGR01319 family)
MDIHLLIDFGSTYTKILAVDLDAETVLGRAQAITTIEDDITIGLDHALANLAEASGIEADEVSGRHASSSAAGGLRMAAIGLVPELTLEAARRAARGAGAKVVAAHGFEIDEVILDQVEEAACDIILLTGGTDGGNKKVILHNARMLANSAIGCPILVAGNRVVTKQVGEILEAADKQVFTAANVLPTLDKVEVEPAQDLIRDIFIAQITEAKGLAAAQKFVGKDLMPTPLASLKAAALLADGSGGEAGIGSLLVVEVGGATTNIHSVVDNKPSDSQTIVRGLPEPRIKRTVEGDLGIRYNAPTIHQLAGDETCMARLRAIDPGLACDGADLAAHTQALSTDVGYVPAGDLEYNIDVILAQSATATATQRHAGTMREEFSVVGAVQVQQGKNLLDTKNLIGTGGIFKYGRHPEKILQAALFSPENPWSLMPKAPKAFIDGEYLLYGVGLLAEHFPVQALRIAKKYLNPVSLEG